MSKSCDQSLSIVFLKFMETTVVKNSAQDGIHVELLLVVDWNDSIEILCWVKWSGRFLTSSGIFGIGVIVHSQVLNN